MTGPHERLFDLVVVGCGAAGCSAALAAQKDRVAVVKGSYGETFMSAGLVTLPPGLGPGPSEDTVPSFLAERLPSLGYATRDDGRTELMGPLGLPLAADLVPWSCRAGHLPELEKVRIIDLGARDLNVRLVSRGFRRCGIDTQVVPLPILHGMTCFEAAREVERDPSVLLDPLSELEAGSDRVHCIPPVLGVEGHGEVRAALDKSSLPPLFEVPCFPPSTTGARLNLSLIQCIIDVGISLVAGRAVSLEQEGSVISSVVLEGPGGVTTLPCERVVLATGGIVPRGIVGGENGFVESLTGVPAGRPRPRGSSADAVDNAIMAGIPVDEGFRVNGFDNLYAAGSVVRSTLRKDLGFAIASGIIAGGGGPR